LACLVDVIAGDAINVHKLVSLWCSVQANILRFEDLKSPCNATHL